MVGLGMLMMLVGLYSLWLRFRGKLYDAPLFHRAAMMMGPAGFIAVLAGWVTTEVGRQPWTVYGLLRTSDSLAPIDAPAVGASLLGFIVVYFAVFGTGIWYLFKMFARPPGGVGPIPGAPERASGLTPAASMKPNETLGAQKTGGDNV